MMHSSERGGMRGGRLSDKQKLQLLSIYRERERFWYGKKCLCEMFLMSFLHRLVITFVWMSFDRIFLMTVGQEE